MNSTTFNPIQMTPSAATLPALRPRFINPLDNEIMNAVISSACEYYNIKETELIEDPVSRDLVQLRRVCFFIILKNTSLYHADVANRFQCHRSTVTQAGPIIDSHKVIYAPTRNLINTILCMANTFDKKYQWHLQ